MKNILLILGSIPFHREVILGIDAYEPKAEPWDLVTTSARHLEHMLQLRDWDGVIGHVASSALADRLHACGLPVVNLSMRLPDTGLPTVVTDSFAIGKIAAEHFLVRGFTSFAFLEAPHSHFSQERLQGYADRITEEGLTVKVWQKKVFTPNEGPPDRDDQAFLTWLAQQPKPVGLFAATDKFAARVNDFCRRHGIRIPLEVAILGCDNDELSCVVNHPPRSSVDLASGMLGRRAAELLQDLMQGSPPPRTAIRMPPGEVVTRQSTEIMAVADPVVAKAMQFLYANLDAPLQVKDLAAAAGVSRRPLETRFQKCLGRTPLRVIHEVRLDKARHLLVSTQASIAEIARQSGHTTPEQFAKLFKAMYGRSPSRYRKQGTVPPK